MSYESIENSMCSTFPKQGKNEQCRDEEWSRQTEREEERVLFERERLVLAVLHIVLKLILILIASLQRTIWRVPFNRCTNIPANMKSIACKCTGNGGVSFLYSFALALFDGCNFQSATAHAHLVSVHYSNPQPYTCMHWYVHDSKNINTF